MVRTIAMSWVCGSGAVRIVKSLLGFPSAARAAGVSKAIAAAAVIALRNLGMSGFS
jgi:hypothetical protein